MIPTEFLLSTIFGIASVEAQRIACAYFVLIFVHKARSTNPIGKLSDEVLHIAMKIPYSFILRATRKSNDIYVRFLSLLAVEFPHYTDAKILLERNPTKKLKQVLKFTSNIFNRQNTILSEYDAEWIRSLGKIDLNCNSFAKIKQIREFWIYLYEGDPTFVAIETLLSLRNSKYGSRSKFLADEWMHDPSIIVEYSAPLLLHHDLCPIPLQILRFGSLYFKSYLKESGHFRSDQELQITNRSCLEVITLLNTLAHHDSSKLVKKIVLEHINQIYLDNIAVLKKVHEMRYPISLIQECVHHIPSLRISI